jgi:hypothetical protein
MMSGLGSHGRHQAERAVMQSAADLGRTPNLVNAQVADDIRHLPTAVAVLPQS